MTTRKTLLATLIVAALAGGAAVALAHGPGAGMGPGMGMGGGPGAGFNAEAFAQRLSDLKAVLKLQPNQEAAWKAYESKVQTTATARAKMFEAHPGPDADRQAHADFGVTMMRFNAQAADEINQARKALYASLSAEQKAAFDRNAPGPMAGGGPGYGMGYGPGFGPGYGRGPGNGPRGTPGFGPGCGAATSAT